MAYNFSRTKKTFPHGVSLLACPSPFVWGMPASFCRSQPKDCREACSTIFLESLQST